MQKPDLTPRDNYLTHTRGAWSWLFTLDHKRIGIMYLTCVLSAFFVASAYLSESRHRPPP